MRSTLTAILLITLSTLLVAADLQGDPATGKAKSVICAGCHGIDGNSVNPDWPKIAGQSEAYFIAQLQVFKQGPAGARRNPNSALMWGMVAGLSEQDMADLAAYFKQQKISQGVADDALAKKGEALYRGGNIELAAAACIGCHGPSGNGNPAAGFPALAGQHAQYVYNQLQAYQQGLRSGDINDSMRDMVKKMSDEDMRAVAEYIQGLH
ncbi:MAG: cytochrome c4 [Gammaproteobacteria bacterium]|nr:cytochrome c4 [Gammaproteobacteria bacterium]